MGPSGLLLFGVLSHVLDVTHALPTSTLLIRSVVVEKNGEDITILNTDTNSVIIQGSASDGGGSQFDIPAILWIIFTLTVGSFLAALGVRGWRITTGMGLGLALAVSSWAAFINTVNSAGISDMVLTFIVFGLFAIGVAVGVFEAGRIVGLAALGFCGGLSLGLRLALFRSGLLIHTFYVNWLIVALFGVLGLGVIVFRQRFGVLSACSLTGSFLVFLGADLVVHKQNGMSLGLRHLFDQNSAHLANLLKSEYNPTIVTQIMLGSSIAISPALAYAQHRFFPQPFDRSARPESIPDFSALYPDTRMKSADTSSSKLGSRFSV